MCIYFFFFQLFSSPISSLLFGPNFYRDVVERFANDRIIIPLLYVSNVTCYRGEIFRELGRNLRAAKLLGCSLEKETKGRRKEEKRVR